MSSKKKIIPIAKLKTKMVFQLHTLIHTTTTTPSIVPLLRSLGKFRCEQSYPLQVSLLTKRLIPIVPQKHLEKTFCI